jgi:hypothetical protein
MDTKLQLEDVEGTDHLGHVRVTGRIIIKGILENRDEGVDRIHLAQNSIRWALQNNVMNLQFPSKLGTFLTS